MSILGLIMAVVVGFIGLIAEGDEGLLFGALVGYCLGAVIQLSSQVGGLKKKIAHLETLLKSVRLSRESEQPIKQPETVAPMPEQAETPVTAPEQQEIEQPVYRTEETQPVTPAPAHIRPAQTENTQPAPKRSSIQEQWAAKENQFKENIVDKLVAFVHRFFTDGNVVVKVGMLILIIGVGFLLKYAYDEKLFVLPMEFRFIGAGILGLSLVVIGWRLRLKKEIYALLLPRKSLLQSA